MQLNPKKIKIRKIVLSEAPIVHLTAEHKKDGILSAQKYLRPYVQIFSKKKVIFNSIEKYFTN